MTVRLRKTVAFWSLHVPCSSMFRLSAHPSDLRFPPVEQASPDGLLAIGGDLQPERLLEAYRHGIFPWYNDDQPILWWSPDPRTVLFPDKLHISRSLKRSLRPGLFSVTLDRCFRDVMQTLRRTKAAISRRRHVDHCGNARGLHALTRTRVRPFR